MPKSYQRLHGPSRLDQFLAYMQTHSDVDILDLRPALREAKNEHQVYFRLDTHWNELGGLVASREVFRAVNLSVAEEVDHYSIKTLADYRIRPELRNERGDLVRMIGYPMELTDNSYVIEPKFNLPSNKQELPNYMGQKWESYPAPFVLTASPNGLRCVVFHDSFAKYFAPFFPEHFQRSLFVWQPSPPGQLFKAVVEAEHPDIVIEEVQERFLYKYETGSEFLPSG